MTVDIIVGDCLESLRALPDGCVQTCVTSPPYFGLRDYGHAGQIGLEKTPDEYVAQMVAVFREVRRVLRGDGTLWLNLGDSYVVPNGSSGGGEYARGPNSQMAHMHAAQVKGVVRSWGNLPAKNLIGIPWRVAFALQADGWYLRQDIIWHKPNPMPESVTDRCTKSHEYIFLLSKSAKYYYDAQAIAEPLASASIERLSQTTLDKQAGSDRVPGKTNGNMKAVYCGSGKAYTGKSTKDYGSGGAQDASVTKARIVDRILSGEIVKRNKRDVWTVTTKPFKGAHFATFPPDLIEPCILAGSRPGSTVLDPFGGAGTTGMVAQRHGRNAVLLELNPDYAKMARERIDADARKQLDALL